jgi:hypothetical protein
MSRRRTHVGALAVALACAVAGALSAAGPAGAASTGFHVYNLSGSPMKLVNVIWDGEPEKGRTAPLPPKVGSMLMPGGPPLHVEIAYDRYNLSNSSVDLYYKPMRSKTDNFIAVHLHDAFRGASCYPQRPYQCRVKNSETITFLDPPGTVNNVPAGDSQEQADVLRDVCNEENTATCTFTPRSRTKTLTQSHITGQPLANCDDEDQTDTRVTREDMVGTKNSFEVGVDTGFEFTYLIAKVHLSIKYKYGREWLEEHKFTQDVSLKVKPGWVGWVAATQPILRDTGDFTLELANTTWNLKDVSFETPDPRTEPPLGAFVRDGRKLSAAEYASTCTHKEPGLKQVPDHFAQMQWEGTSDRDVLLAGTESHTVTGLAGNDLLRGGPGHDSLDGGRDDDALYGGRHNDTLDGGRHDDVLDGGLGRDTLNGGPGADMIIDEGGPTRVHTGRNTGPGKDTVDVRDGRADDTVVCGSRRSTVEVDAGDSVIGPCGKLSRSDRNR